MRGSKKNGSRSKISDRTWAEVKAAYHVGKEPIGTIADNHKISRKSIERRAKAEDWKYGVLSDEVAKEVERATVETITGRDIDIATKATSTFLRDAEHIRSLTMAILSGLARELKKSGGAVSRAEAERILFCQRANETTAKTITSIYNNVRKALGMDREEELKRSAPKQDPCEGMSEEEVAAKIEELQS